MFISTQLANIKLAFKTDNYASKKVFVVKVLKLRHIERLRANIGNFENLTAIFPVLR
jgi:hypothetical protein